MDSAQYHRLQLASERLELAALDRGQLKCAFTEVADLLGGGMFQLINVTNPAKPELVVAPSLVGVQEDYVVNGWHEIDIWTHRARSTARPGKLLQTELIPSEIRRRHPFFQEFCPRWNIGRFDAWTFDLCGEMWGYTFMAAEESGPDEALSEMLRGLMPTANRSALLASTLQDAVSDGIVRGLDLAGRACFVINHMGKVEYATRAGEALIGQGFIVTKGELKGLTVAAERNFRKLSEQARASRPAGLSNFIIDRTGGLRPLLAMPISLRDRDLDGMPGARVIMMLADLEPRISGDRENRLRQLFGLTLRQCELVRLLATGRGIEEVSDLMGVTRATTRSSLKQIFAKTDTQRQGELVALVARILE